MKIILEEYEDQHISIELGCECESYHMKIKQFAGERDITTSLDNFKRIVKYLNEMDLED